MKLESLRVQSGSSSCFYKKRKDTNGLQSRDIGLLLWASDEHKQCSGWLINTNDSNWSNGNRISSAVTFVRIDFNKHEVRSLTQS